MFALPDAGHCSNPGDSVHVTVKQGHAVVLPRQWRISSYLFVSLTGML